MDRRDFIRWSAAMGVGVAVTGLEPERAHAAPYDGPLYMFFNAIGGWDTTMLCDPKGNDLNRSFGPGEILTHEGIHYAPLKPDADAFKDLPEFDFFKAHGSRLLVLNGMDMASPNHSIGQRYIWTGRANSKAYPCFGALAAAAASPAPPMAWLSFGEYDQTGGLVALSRVQSREQLVDVLDPGAIERDNQRYYDEQAAAIVRQAVRARAERQLVAETLPRRKSARAALFAAHLGAAQLREMKRHLPDTMPAEIEQRGLRGAATLAVAAMRSGLCVAANFSLAVFDTHGDNDASQNNRLTHLLRDVDFAIKAADDAGLRDRLTIVIGSDFGRTPAYNDAQGKDHWSIGSAMILGPGIRGGRVIGATDEALMPKTVNAETLALDPSGIRLRPEHLHLALRKRGDLNQSDGAALYPLEGEDLDLFS